LNSHIGPLVWPIRLMAEIDKTIDAHSGRPAAFAPATAKAR
jgi:hypothetical protein